MRLFKCQVCQQIVYFENTICERCSHKLGYLPHAVTLSALEPEGDVWRALAAPEKTWRYCANAVHGACNWLVDAGSTETLCLSCRHNRTIPDLGVPDYLNGWRKIETAKHRLFYSLVRLDLPLATRTENETVGLVFDVLADPPGEPRVMTGHDNGLITLALIEADDAHRERNRVQLHEPYRTLLGHFRHEIGHYFWDRLVDDGGRLDDFRALFGDDRQDYGQALQQHYSNGPPQNWQESFVSAYASTHPWEDFAETWAHYLHIVDTLEIAGSFGMSTRPALTRGDELDSDVHFDPYRAAGIGQLVDSWMPLSVALNSLNRAMGQSDLYPFVLSAPMIDKLGFVHSLVQPAPTAVR